MLRSLLIRVVVGKTGLTLQLYRMALAEQIPLRLIENGKNATDLHIDEVMTIRRRGQEMRPVVGAEEQPEARPDDGLILLIARAALLEEQLVTNEVASTSEFAEAQGLHYTDAKKLVLLGYLAPSIVEEILAGHQPVELPARALHRMHGLPLC